MKRRTSGWRSPSNRLLYWLLTAIAVSNLAGAASAGVLTFSGLILQSTPDGTGPAANNLALNNIQDGDPYTVTLDLAGSAFSSISAPGSYDLTGGSLLFSDPSAPASEASFGSISLTVSPNGAFDDLSLLGCLTTGSGCLVGNELTANFEIPATLLNSQNVAATGLDQPHPLDLLEDDGTTDIHGSITAFSGTASAVPEPSSTILLACVFTALFAANRRR